MCVPIDIAALARVPNFETVLLIRATLLGVGGWFYVYIFTMA